MTENFRRKPEGSATPILENFQKKSEGSVKPILENFPRKHEGSSLAIFKIGEGSFGKVYEVDKDTVVKFTRLEDSEIQPFTVKELCFLSQYSNPYIIKMTDAYYTKNHKVLEMEHGGKDLHQWVKTADIHTVKKYLPSIVYQLLTVLAFLENNGFMHGDIKPSNITIKEDADSVAIKVIDWGSICFVPKLKIFNTCTHSLSAPELLNREIIKDPNSKYARYYKGNIGKYNIKNDIFSLGLVIKYILYKEYFSPIDIYKYSIDHNFIPLIKKDSSAFSNKDIDDLDVDFLNICQKMLCCDQSKRPTAIELWRDKYFDLFRNSDKFYKNIDCVELPDVIQNYDDKYDFTYKDRENVLLWAYDQINHVNKQHMFTLGLWIFDKYLSISTDEILKDDLYVLIAVCMKISDVVLYCFNMSILTWLEALPKDYTVNQFNKITNYILRELKFNVFRKTFDMFIKNPDYEIVLQVCKSDEYLKTDINGKIQMYQALCHQDNKAETA